MDYWWVWSRQSASVKLRTTKFSSEGLGCNSAKFCTSENFPLCGTCHTATCTNSAILSAIAARLPSIECSLQEANYLSKGKTVVCPVVPELASSFKWCGSQNLVVSVASIIVSMYGLFVQVQSLSAVVFYRRQVCSSVSEVCLKVSLILLLLVSMERIPWTNQEQDIKYYNTYTTVTMDLSWKPHLSLGLCPRDRVVFRNKSLVSMV